MKRSCDRIVKHMFKIMFMKSLQQVGKLLALQSFTEQAGKKIIYIYTLISI